MMEKSKTLKQNKMKKKKLNQTVLDGWIPEEKKIRL